MGKALERFSFGLVVATICCMLVGTAYAVPSAEFKYLETAVGSNVWQYDYTLYNTSDPVEDVGFDLYDVFFEFNAAATFTLVSLPTGWDLIDGTGFGYSFSTIPGTPTVGSDIAPGSSLSGFVFQLDYKAGNLPFGVSFVNPNDFENPEIYNALSSPVGSIAPVPEPSTLLLLGSGLAGILGLRRKFRTN